MCSVGSDQDGKVGSVVFFPSPICKESFLPCHPTPTAQSFLLSIKQTYWHRAGCRQGKGFHHYFDPVHQVTMFFPLSGVASGGRRYPRLGLRPRATCTAVPALSSVPSKLAKKPRLSDTLKSRKGNSGQARSPLPFPAFLACSCSFP